MKKWFMKNNKVITSGKEFSEEKFFIDPRLYQSPLYMLIIVSLAIFIIEFFVMVFIHYMFPITTLTGEFIIDSLFLTILMFPVLYFFLFRPLLLYISEREQTEEALQKSEEKFRLLFENANDSIFIIDPKTRHFLDVNENAVKHLGYTKDELLGLTTDDIDAPLATSRNEEILQELQQKGSVVFEHVHRRKDGTEIPVEISTRVIKYGEEEVFQSIARDISERKRAEKLETSIYKISEAVHSTETLDDLFRFVHETIAKLMPAKNCYIALYDEENDLLSFPYFIDEFDKKPARKKLGKGLTEYILRTGEPLLASPEVFEKLSRQGDVKSMGTPSVDWLGVPLKTNERTMGVLSVQTYTRDVRYNKEHRDILMFVSEQVAMAIEHKKAEEALKNSEANFRNLFRLTSEAIIIQDQNRNIIDLNRSAERLFGYQKEELVEHPEIQLSDREKTDQNLFNKYIDKVLAGEAQRFEWWGLTKNGNSFPEEIILNKTIYDGKEVLFTIIRDITDLKREEAMRNILYQISEAVHTTRDLESLFIRIYNELGKMMDVTNFYIAIYEKENNVLSFPYIVDENLKPEDKEKSRIRKFGKGLTEYTIKQKKPMLYRDKFIQELAKRGEIEIIGTMPKIWLGAPLVVEEEVIGLIGLQSYFDPSRYSSKDLELLEFVSDQIAVAIERKMADQKIKKSLKEKEILLREIHHRVKNNLQIISSLFSLQSDEISDTGIKEIFQDSQNRIRSLALVHEKLYQSEDFASVNLGEYLKSLIEQIYRTYYREGSRISIHFDLDPISLPMDRAVPSGIVVNELVTNALKHAFPEGEEGGEIKISLKSKKDDTLELVVMDNGIGLPKTVDFQHPTTLGLTLVSMLVKDQLQGTLTIQRKGGTEFRILFGEIKK